MFKKNNTISVLFRIIFSYVLIIILAFIYAVWFYQLHIDSDNSINELHKLRTDISELKNLQNNFLDKESLDELLFNTGKNKLTENFESRFEKAQNRINKLGSEHKKNSELGILYNSLKADLLKLNSENILLIKYTIEAGSENSGLYNHLIIAEYNFQKKLDAVSGVSVINDNFNQIKIYRKVFYLYNDFQILNISISHIETLLTKLNKKKGNSNNYKYLRLIDGLQEYKRVFNLFARKLMQIGIRKDEGIRQNLTISYQKIDDRLIAAISQVKINQKSGNILTLIIVLALILLSITINFLFHFRIAKQAKQFLKQSEQFFTSLISGKQVKAPDILPNDDYLELQKQMNFFSEKIGLTYAMMSTLTKMGGGQLKESSYKDTIFPEIARIDKHIKSLNKQLKAETNETLVNEWIRKGLSSFSDVLRRNFDKPVEHANEILSNLVAYLSIPMGAIYLPSSKQDNSFDLVGSIAFGKKKHHPRSVIEGEGIIGTAVKERKTINISDIPEDYFKISSGFGEAKPKNIIVLPIKLEEKVFGIIELASLSMFKKFELEFIDELSKTLGASFAISSVFLETKENLEKSEKESLLNKIDADDFKEEVIALKQKGVQLEDIKVESEIINENISTFALVAELDLDGNILDMNNAFVELLKKPKENLIRTNYLDYTSRTGVENANLEKLWNGVRSGVAFNLEQNFQVLQKNIWLSEAYIPIKDKSGKVLKIKIIAINRTGLKTIENQFDELKESFNNKEKILKQNKSEFNSLNEKIVNQAKEIEETQIKQTEVLNKLKEEHLQILSKYVDEQKEDALYDQITMLRNELENLKK